jgi:hypothetical protein
MMNNIPESSENQQNNANDCEATEDPQSIFDQRFQIFMDQFGEICEKEDVPISIAIVVDPKIQDQPLVFTRGGTYETATVMAHVLRNMKQMINDELNTN